MDGLRWLTRLAVATVLASAGGCAGGPGGAPVQEMSDARQALEAARRAEAVAPVRVERAQAWLERARQRLDAGEYDGARRAARAAREFANPIP
ncbi:DUF4398 domain-containing protein [Arhodomonas sp. SL1]|uniref:DUF4398 domain-containing protein n=1 Tax=Arhodomonas sp. SL1 TaxID=3425691 RepID=UPI003F884568